MRGIELDWRLGRSAWCAALLLVGPGAMAQQAQQLDDMVITASRSEQSLADVAGNTAVIGQDELTLIGHTHINEAMFRVPGAWISRGNGQEHLTAIRSPVFTGPGACGEFLMAQDGIGLRAAGFCNVNELFQVNSEQAGRIEVVRGPAGPLYGSNAMHGMVNVITAAPPAERETVVDLEAGPHDYVRGKLTTGARYDRNAYRFNLNLARDGGFRDDSGFDQQKSDLRWDYLGDDMSAQTVFSVTNLDQETAGFIEGLDVYKDRDALEQNLNPEAFRKVRSARVASRLDFFVDANSTFSVTPYARWNDMDFLQHFLPQTPLEENGHTSIGLQSAWYRTLASGNNLIVGIDWEFTRGFLKETQDLPTTGAFPQGLHYDYEVDARVIAPFAQLEWSLGEDTLLVGGLRVEQVRYEYDNQMIDGNTAADGTTPCTNFAGTAPADCRFSRPADRADTFDNASPKLGVVHDLGGDRQVYGNLSRGFRAPQTTELYRLQGNQTVSEIESERLDSLEVGYRARSDALSYDMSVFAMRKKNFIFQDGSRFVVSDGKTRHMGVELSMRWAFDPAFDLGAFLTYAEHKYDFDATSPGNEVISDGNYVDTAPKTLGSVVGGWNYAGGRAELEWIHMGSYFMDAANQFEYAGHDLLNLRASYALTPTWTLFGRILNLSDERYAERADFSAFATDNARYFPGEPRSLFVGLRGEF